MKTISTLIVVTIMMIVNAGPAAAQDLFGQQDRAMYAGAYLTMSFGGTKKATKRPVRYGFSAGWRQQNFGASHQFSSHSVFRHDRDFGYAGYGNIDARVVDLSFSDRGFDRLSLSGLSLAQADDYGTYATFGRRYATEGGADGEKDSDSTDSIWKAVLIGGAVVAVGVGVVAIAQFQGGG